MYKILFVDDDAALRNVYINTLKNGNMISFVQHQRIRR